MDLVSKGKTKRGQKKMEEEPYPTSLYGIWLIYHVYNKWTEMRRELETRNRGKRRKVTNGVRGASLNIKKGELMWRKF